ncbi:metal-dependent hydrolase family protein [Spirosoma pollinicola]|uniref:Amidohydrolase family protein n=1 Tax=Spirosoma pollinicola TaxID=2057025 RepID=A0A2K8YW35_9BACT|nr:amidohydrolase family protein [Spirosoma pollinicola]AUD01768.1 amidohydrolase family protein [Spirosoma pollinicola]
MRLKRYGLRFLIACCLSTGAFAQKTALLCKRLIDGTGKIVQNAAIVIEADRIIAVGSKDIIPKDASVIDLGDFTVLPGLIDAHVHPFIDKDDYQIDHLRRSSAQKALEGLKIMQDLLQAGWTTLRIAGDADVAYAQFDIRNAINKGLFTGPHIYGAGHYISVTGGGGDINFTSYEQPIIADGLIANGPDEMRKAVREEIKHGSDWIKIMVTGAFMTVGDNPQDVHFSSEELTAVMEEANRRHRPVMAHAHATEGIKMAVRAGVRSIEHASYIDEEGIDLMLKNGTYLIPTLSVDLFFQEKYFNSKALAKAVQLGKHEKDENTKSKMLSLAIRKGVKIGLGTDNVGFPATFPAREFAELIKLGMTPMQAIQAGTKVNAELLGKEKDLGTIEAGKLADIIAVKGDPLTDITELQQVKFVMIGGKVVKSDN